MASFSDFTSSLFSEGLSSVLDSSSGFFVSLSCYGLFFRFHFVTLFGRFVFCFGLFVRFLCVTFLFWPLFQISLRHSFRKVCLLFWTLRQVSLCHFPVLASFSDFTSSLFSEGLSSVLDSSSGFFV